MTLSLDAALSGLLQQQRSIELIANNLGNVNTPGYKRAEVHFEDVFDTVQILEVLRGERIVGDATVPSGVQSDAVDRVFLQGPLVPTNRDLDWTVIGEGMFGVLLEDGTPAYARAGNFLLDAGGAVVTSDGLRLDPPLSLPDGWSSLEVASDGAVSVLRPPTLAEIAATPPGDVAEGLREVVGQLQLTRFDNPQGLASIGASLYVATADSGPVIAGAPAADGMGTVVSGVLEGSNVDLATELSALVVASRAYQLNLQAYRSVEEMLSAANSLPTAWRGGRAVIEPVRPQDASGIYRRNVARSAEAAELGGVPAGWRSAATSRNDEIALSARARELCGALAAVAAQPETRAELVAALRHELADGTYRPDPAAIARRMLAERGSA